MRIVALTFGTEGDSRPMIALCRGLRDSGHDVTLLAERTAHAYAESLGVPFVFGGTSLLIVVGVAMDTVNQVESQLIMRHYDGFMKKTRIRGRRGQ